MKEYKVSSGPTWETTVSANNHEQALIKALQKDKPTELGILIETDDNIDPVYWNTITALKKAGLHVNE